VLLGERKDNYSARAIVSATAIQSGRFRREAGPIANPIAAEYFDRFINSDKKTAAERRRSSSPTSAYSASAFVGGNAANIRAR